tara:strand:- start:88 stop:363 length:276 start_codon:yes stop_codon:yes gene_type:complete
MMVTTHLQLECEELQLLDPNSKLAFFTRQLFAQMVNQFGLVPKSVELRHYSCVSFVRHQGCDSSVDQNPYNLCNVRDSLKALNIEFTEVDM